MRISLTRGDWRSASWRTAWARQTSPSPGHSFNLTVSYVWIRLYYMYWQYGAEVQIQIPQVSITSWAVNPWLCLEVHVTYIYFSVTVTVSGDPLPWCVSIVNIIALCYLIEVTWHAPEVTWCAPVSALLFLFVSDVFQSLQVLPLSSGCIDRLTSPAWTLIVVRDRGVSRSRPA